MPQSFSQRAKTSTSFSQRAKGEPKPVTVPLSQAMLYFADSPKKEEFFKSLKKIATIDGRGLTDYDLDKSKAVVKVDDLKKLQGLKEKVVRLGTGDLRKAESDLFEKQQAKASDQLLERRKLVPKAEWARYGLDDASIALSARFTASGMTPTKPKYESSGKMHKAAEEQLQKTTQDFLTARGTPLEGLANNPLTQTVGYLGGTIASTPSSILEGVEFLLDPKYREQVNPQGTSALDYLGAAAKLYLNLGAPGAGKAGVALTGKAVEKGLTGRATGPILDFTLKRQMKAALQEADAVQIGKALMKEGVDSKTAARTAYSVSQAIRAATPEDIDLVFQNIEANQLALPGKVDTNLALPEPDPIRDVLRGRGTADDLTSRLAEGEPAATAQQIPPGGYVTPEPKVDKTAPEAPIKGTQASTPTQTPIEAQKPSTGQPGAKEGVVVEKPANVAKATSLANRPQEVEALQGVINDVEPTTGKGSKDWQAEGKASLDSMGSDETRLVHTRNLSKSVGEGSEELTGKSVGELLEGKRIRLNRIETLQDELRANPKSKDVKQALVSAEQELDDYLTNIQAGKGRWSDVGRALQAGTTLDAGNYAEVITKATRNAESHGGKVYKSTAQKLEQMSGKVKELEAKIAKRERAQKRHRAEGTVKAAKSRKFDREAIRTERTDILKEIDEILSRPVSGSLGSGAGGFSPETAKNLAALAKPVGRLALNVAKEGAATLEDVVIAVQKILRDKGIEVDDQFVIDSMSEPSAKRSVSDARKEINKLRRQARNESTANKAKIQAKIDDLERQASSGIPDVKTQAEVKVSKELENLRAQRDMWAGRVRSLVEAQKASPRRRAIRQVASAIRGIKLGSDIGVLIRQGLFLWNPKRVGTALKSVVQAGKSAFSENNLALWARRIDTEVLPNGRVAGPYYKKMGLQLADSITNHEEIVSTALIRQAFDLPAKALEKAGAKNSAQALRVVTDAVGGSLERFQTVFINNARAEMMKKAIRAGYSDDELRNMARFINNVTGRGNLKRVGETAELIFTSPRYETSRWNTIGEFFRQPAKFGAGLTKGKIDRSALSAMGDLAATAGTVVGVMKLLQAGGWDVTLDPESPDFLKARNGEQVIDITAGIAPRIRDVVRLVINAGDPGYNKTLGSVSQKAIERTFSPAVRTPVEQASFAYQRSQGVDTPKSPFSGFETSDDEAGWKAWAPLIVSQYFSTVDEDPTQAAQGAGIEFIGGSVQRYPQR